MKDYRQYLSQGLISQKHYQHPRDLEFTSYSPFLCSLSGGQDSTSLFFLLFHFFNRLQISSGKVAPLTVFYCHHFWQPKNVFLMRFLLQLTVLFHSHYFVTFSKKSVPNENRSRHLRKKSLSRIAILQKTNTLLTGHTETDRFETIFINLIRGTTGKNFSPRTVFQSKKEETFLFSSFKNNSTNILSFEISCLRFQTFNQKRQEFKKVESSSTFFFVFFSQESLLFCPEILSELDCCQFLNFETHLLLKMRFFETQVNSKNLRSKSGKAKEIERGHKFGNFPKEIKKQRNHFFYSKKNPQQVYFLKQRQGFFSFFQQKSTDSILSSNLYIFRKRTCSKFVRQFWKVKQGYRAKNFRFYKELSSSFCFYSFSSVEIFWWKPFTTTKRIFVKNYLDFFEFPLFTDLTNFSSQFSRNKIRHQFLPFFKLLFHEKIEKLVIQCFQIHGDEHQIIENKVTELLLISFLADSLPHFFQNFSSLERRNPSKWFLANVSQSLQLAFLRKLLFNHKNREGTFLQFSALKNQFFNGPKTINGLNTTFVPHL